jgi:hypothetical protein
MHPSHHHRRIAVTTRWTLALLLAVGTDARAQENPVPAAPEAAAPAQTEMQKWIATTDAQWQAAFKRDVTDVHEAELNKVKLQYLTALEDGIKKASGASDLDGAVALRNEQKRFGDTNVFPEQDEAGDAVWVKQFRATIRAQLAKLEKEKAARTKALHAKYDQVLASAQAQLTKASRLDDALLVKAKRDEVAAAWITPAIAAAAEKATLPVTAATGGNTQKPVAPEMPLGTSPPREVQATIPANTPNAFRLGAVRSGTKISLQYLTGKWKAWGILATSNPDDETTDGGEQCRVVIALPSMGGGTGKVLAVVPPDTKTKPFVYTTQADHTELVLRINGRGKAFSSNPGSVEYSVKITPPGR